MPDYESVSFGQHCRERQRQREITRQQKLFVIKNHEIEYPQRRKNRRKFSASVDGSKLYVVIIEAKDGKKAHVLTTYWSD